MPEVGVLVAVGAEHRQQRLDRLRPAQLAQRDRREEAHSRARVVEQADQPVEGLRLSHLAQHLGRLGADLGVGVGEQGLEHGPLADAARRQAWCGPPGPAPRSRESAPALPWRDPATAASVCQPAPPRAASSNCASWRTRMSGWASSRASSSSDRRSIPSASSALTSRNCGIAAPRLDRARGRSAPCSACPSPRPSRRSRAPRRGRSRRRSPAPTRRTAWNRPPRTTPPWARARSCGSRSGRSSRGNRPGKNGSCTAPGAGSRPGRKSGPRGRRPGWRSAGRCRPPGRRTRGTRAALRSRGRD